MKRLWLVGLSVALGGCAERYSIRPTQLSQLNDEIATNREVRIKVRLETVDGRIVEVNPPVVVYVTTNDGQEHYFCSPLRATFEGGAVTIKHNCGRSVRLEGGEISKVELEEFW